MQRVSDQLGAYYQWMDQFLASASKSFDARKLTRKEDRLERKNEKPKLLVGELMLELKKRGGAGEEKVLV